MLGLPRLRTALVAAVLAPGALGATELVWPEYFAPPTEAEPPDSAAFAVGTEQAVYGRTFESKDTLRWGIFDSAYVFRQTSRYSLSRRYGTQYQFLDLSGEYARTTILGRAMSLGLEWDPLLELVQQRDANGWFQTTLDLGPAWRTRLLGVPLALRAGFSAKGWNDSVPEDFTMTHYADFHGAAGFYGGLEIGGTDRLFSRIPLYASLSAFGRHVEDVGLGIANGSLLYGQGLPSGDSLFVYVADSVSDGRESFMGEASGGMARTINTPWRIENSLRASAGLKGAPRLRLVPEVLYTLRQSLVTYPDAPGLLNDRTVTGHEVTLLLGTDTTLFLNYQAALGFVVEDEDWLFRAGSLDSLTATNRDSVLKNNEDYRRTGVVMEHALTIPLPKGMEVAYAYAIARRSWSYANACDDSTVYNYNDYDRQRQAHELSATLLHTERWNAALSGRFMREVLNYTKARRSGGNRIDRTYRLQAGLSYDWQERLSIGEVLSAEASVAEYVYPKAHQGATECPPYSRRFTSVLSAAWQVSQRWRLEGVWNETYWDDGYWYGAEYFVAAGDSTAAPEQLDYYAIQRKSTEYVVELSVAYAPVEHFTCKAGGSLQDIFQRDYNGTEYETRHYGKGYVLKPYLEVRWTLRDRFHLRAHVERLMNTYDEKLWSWRDNWDIRIRAGLEF